MFNYTLYPVLFLFLIGQAQAGIGNRMSNQVGRSVSNAISKNIADNYIRPQLTIKNSSGAVRSITFDSKKTLMAIVLEDGSIRVWDLSLGIQRPAIFPVNSSFTAIAIDAKHQLLFAGKKNGTIQVFDILTAKAINQIMASEHHSITGLALNDHNQLLAASDAKQIFAFDTQQPKLLWSLATDGPIKGVTVLEHFGAIRLNDQKIMLLDLNSGLPIKTIAPVDEAIIHLSAQPALPGFVIGYENGALVKIAPETGAVTGRQQLNGEWQVLTPSASQWVATYSADEHLTQITNMESGHQVSLQTETSAILFLAFSSDQDKVFIVDEHGGIYLFDCYTGKKELQIISTVQGWTVLDETGRFDSSEPGLVNIAWDMEGFEVPLDNFSGRYYEPGLFTLYLQGKTNFFNKNPGAVKEGVTLPPLVNITLPEIIEPGKPANLKVTATGRKGGVQAIAVFQNGKALPLPQEAIKTERQGDITVKHITLQFIPQPGQNTLEAIASNDMGIESDKARQVVTLDKRKDKQAAKTLHIVAVGINNYADPRLNLDYSVADAHSVAEVLKNKKNGDIAQADTVALFNKKATKHAIVEAITDAGNHQPADILAVYFAGHGVVIDGEWYFLPYETTLHAQPEYFTQVGLSGQEIKDLLIATQAQKIILFIDSCYSGAGLDAFNYLINAQRYMGRNLSRSVGIVVLTAARKNQKAAELPDLGHGLFTYYLTKGMRGAADNRPSDKKITAYEVVDFPQRHIPELAKQYVGASQDPVVFKMGMDFDLLQK